MGDSRDFTEFDDFYTQTSRKLIGQVYAFTGNLGDAEDALQEAYIRAWQQWSTIREYESPEGWVRSVACRLSTNAWWKARNRLSAHRRAEARREPVPDLGPDLLALISALKLLPEKQRQVLVLHYVADLTVEQIAEEAGTAPGTVKSRLARGRAALAPLVSEFSDEEPDRPRENTNPPAAGSPRAVLAPRKLTSSKGYPNV
ncbi:SigE family RNA polymerase sigma factor [Actinospica durhamensis]|uniref:SigE family RNA polymerase sigma factor n=1 Tax=Actinospica durhamensis TaxID=1508375 RepID=A0A941IP85_9ACTN|nr:SigE family RNA polymerase sigma factor [Actinospica durhamensis]MBR7836265.1 SigE family RNA polymerase sigma factor [Actinospica durhamensis]